jgi:NAD(P)-dependent dehydrogenase (short-subunit alcohol dehydrogenase family)
MSSAQCGEAAPRRPRIPLALHAGDGRHDEACALRLIHHALGFAKAMEKETAMTEASYSTALIVGAGSGLSAALARTLAGEGIKVALAARTTADLDPLAAEIHAHAITCDATQRDQVESMFAELDASFGAPEIVVYNASYRVRGALIDLDPREVEKSLLTSAYGGFLVAQAAVRRMLPKQHGAILFTGASASVKGYPQSAPFAMGKFALRGLAQSMARELHPQGIHVAHVVIDGAIRSAQRPEPADKPASMLDPKAIAATYLHIIRQPRSAWCWEVELRPWVERF